MKNRFLMAALAVATGLCTGMALAEQLRPELRPDLRADFRSTSDDIQLAALPDAAVTTLATVTPVSVADPILGPETNLPLPRFVSLKSSEGNVRRGPSLSHRIDWVFLRRGMPLQVTAEYGHWRRVTDREGLGGWVHYALLSGTRTVLIEENMLAIYARPDIAAPQEAVFEAGVIARLGDCTIDWCEITSGGYRGWAEKDALWGVMPDEIRQ